MSRALSSVSTGMRKKSVSCVYNGHRCFEGDYNGASAFVTVSTMSVCVCNPKQTLLNLLNECCKELDYRVLDLPSASTKLSGLQKGLEEVIPVKRTLIRVVSGDVTSHSQLPLGLSRITSVPPTETFNTGASFVNTKLPPHVVTVTKK